MPEYCVTEDPSDEMWSSVLNMFPTGNFEHSIEYGKISKKAFPRTKVARLGIKCNGEPIGIIQGTYSSYLGFGMNLGVIRGPVIYTKDEDKLKIVERLIEALEEYGKKNRIIKFSIKLPEAWQLNRVFEKFGYALVGKLNEYMIDLEKGPEALWENIAHNKRRNIRRAIKEGVDVFRSRNFEDLYTFYSMLKASEKRGGFSSYPLSWFKAIWEIWEPKELSNIFFARWRNDKVSGIFTVIHNNTVYALASGSFKEGWKARPNDILHWKAMEWAYENGYSKYHMGLVSEPTPIKGSSSWGIWRWKREWRGDLNKILIYEKVLLPKYKFIIKSKMLAETVYNVLIRFM